MLLHRRYEIGEGLYIGWSSATLAICGGSCLMCACKASTSNEKMWVCVAETFRINSLGVVESVHILLTVTRLLCFRPYPYQPSSRGHVLSTVPMSQSVPSNYGRNAYVWEVCRGGKAAWVWICSPDTFLRKNEQCILLWMHYEGTEFTLKHTIATV